MKLSINLQKETYVVNMTELLTDARPYSKEEDSVKCLVCSNESTMTYVFLIYEDKAK